MKEYRAYVIGPDGHIVRRIDLYCADEEAAKERARQLANREPIELWQGDQCIARFKPTQENLRAPSRESRALLLHAHAHKIRAAHGADRPDAVRRFNSGRSCNPENGGRQRPLCEFPTWPKYNGSGDMNRAESFKCVAD
jgi:tannase/feruloyl esterase